MSDSISDNYEGNRGQSQSWVQGKPGGCVGIRGKGRWVVVVVDVILLGLGVEESGKASLAEMSKSRDDQRFWMRTEYDGQPNESSDFVADIAGSYLMQPWKEGGEGEREGKTAGATRTDAGQRDRTQVTEREASNRHDKGPTADGPTGSCLVALFGRRAAGVVGWWLGADDQQLSEYRYSGRPLQRQQMQGTDTRPPEPTVAPTRTLVAPRSPMSKIK
ncbi:predicted protein [Uncinocarpus reesii 1704]|uniref:Uncharacterized protein n=1 Tax=Uncinocarpus reesii (strain UAMH 1704) TaxID=336963 RepID=C4JKC4_UNCRE|nr:uncharacterized protein UREG_02081 [Uncinocarpus reesii 1704]EEP77232.1 predicted protein [Uncinocarpus reesii 1704]